MPKRSRNPSSSNPLSDARKGVGIAQKKTIDLWHRKSGAGYHLFLEYYASQPRGVVADAADFEGAGNTCTTSVQLMSSNSKAVPPKVGAGMSRAAKKRQKKKAKTSTVKESCAEATSIANEFVPVDDEISNISAPASNKDSSNPLIQAFASKLNHRHLASYVTALASPLPLTFRIRKNESSSTEELKETLAKQYTHHITPVSYDPSKSIYQSTKSSGLSKSTLGTIPQLKELIVSASTNGSIARQEIGSMLPVLALKHVHAITPGAKCLDLCASPGSKTLQALEIVAQGGKGRIIANDVHAGRLDSLKDAVSRSGLPKHYTSRVTYTNYDASSFPPPKSGNLFDAIICDVPCSGDGTIRKDKHILPMWTPGVSNELHRLQLQVLNRALTLVKVGGFVCYSTCSLNPVEDEAVVAAALQQVVNEGGNSRRVELVDWPNDLLSGFIRRPGVVDWKVGFYHDQSSDIVEEGAGDFGSISFYANERDAKEAGMDTNVTLWPPESSKIDELHLDRCLRLLPQDNDTGGFFVAIFKRLK
ncbi:hypothetical protein ACHAWO_006213 [Cyclotella atomus]|uniref:SAM-dependent MTase RsmB/NOP-type domain-containing protein n=1 Tax=Cyclotella atomus TaxID=382360 RepID=A0ABD3QZF9_9STRA